jgi:outer membrane protein assembly factor BamB
LKLQLRGRHLALLLSLLAVLLVAGCAGGAAQGSWFGVTASDDVVYLAANEKVVALSVESGAELWTYPITSDGNSGPFFATPLVKSNVVNLGGYDADGTLFILSASQGTQQGAVITGAPMVEGPTSTDGALVVGNDVGEVYLIEPETQERRLLLKADESIWATPLVDQASGRVYVSSMDHHLYAVDLERGEELWTFKASGALVGTPALSDGMVYFGSLNNSFFAVDAETGTERWRTETEGWVWGGPLIDADTVYFGDLSGKVYALDASDGSQRWISDVEGGVRATPLLVDGLLYVGTRKGRVYALVAEDGTQQWARDSSGAIYSQPVMGGGLLLVSPHNAKMQLLALDPESGAERWAYPPQEE